MDENKINLLKLGIGIVIVFLAGYLVGSIKPAYKLHCAVETNGQLNIIYETHYIENLLNFDSKVNVNGVDYNALCIKVN